MTVPRTVKITNAATGVTMYNLVTSCAKCNCDVVVPEIFASWYRRTFAESPEHMRVDCLDCGGKVIDPYIWHSSTWKESAAPEKQPEQKPVLVHDMPFDDDDYYPLFHGFQYHNYTDKSFFSAHSKLKTFMVPKEEPHVGQSESVEPGV